MATTTNFGWTTPDDTDLVKDGAAAIRTLGSAIDTSLVDLKGGTTGQVLAKASNTDLDYTWSSVDPLTILDAKGDLISATAADTPARLAVGSNGQVLTADSAEATGLKWAAPISGAYTSLASGSLSTATGTLTLSSISGSYKDLYLIIRDLVPTGTIGPYIRVTVDSVTNYDYFSASFVDTLPTLDGTRASTYIQTRPYKNTDDNNLFVMRIENYTNTETSKHLHINHNFIDYSYSPNSGQETIFATAQTTAAITAITVKFSSGNFAVAGTYELFGVK